MRQDWAGLYKEDGTAIKDKLVLPGGKVDPGETHEQCAIREAFEETNLQLSNVRLLVRHWWPHRNDAEGIEISYFIADADLDNFKIVEKDKHSEYKFITLEELASQENKYVDEIYCELKKALNES